MRKFKISQQMIGRDYPPFIIAEMSGNHNGSLKTALRIVDESNKLTKLIDKSSLTKIINKIRGCAFQSTFVDNFGAVRPRSWTAWLYSFVFFLRRRPNGWGQSRGPPPNKNTFKGILHVIDKEYVLYADARFRHGLWCRGSTKQKSN